MFLVKLSAQGEFEWVKTLGGKRSDWGNQIAVSSKNEILFTGTYNDTASFGSTILNGRGSYDIYLGKLTTEGDLLWMEQAGGVFGITSDIDFEAGRGVFTDENDNVYLVDRGKTEDQSVC